MRMRIAALCVIFLFWGNVAEAWQAALTLKQLGQETCLQMVDYGGALLVETLEGLYMQREGGFVPLSGDFHLGSREALSAEEQSSLWDVAYYDKDAVPPGSSVDFLIVSRQGELYSLCSNYLGVNKLTLSGDTLHSERLCALDWQSFVTAPEQAPHLFDAVIDGDMLYFLCGSDPMQGEESLWAERLMRCDLRTGETNTLAQGTYTGLCFDGEGMLLATVPSLNNRGKLVRISPETGAQDDWATVGGTELNYPRLDPSSGDCYFTSGQRVYVLHPSGQLEMAFNLSSLASAGVYDACYTPELGYVVITRLGIETAESQGEQVLYVRGLTETYAQAYMLETGINVQSLGSFEPSAEELATQMLMQGTAADLYCLELDTQVLELIAKGYYTPLQGQAELAQAYQRLRPFVRDWVTWEEDFAVFPVYLSLRGPAYDPALRTEVPPETWEDWLRELLTRVENDPDGEQPLFEGRYTRTDLRSMLVEALLEQYWLACGTHGLTAAQTALETNLTLALALCETIEPSHFSSADPLFRLNYVLSPALQAENMTPLSLAFLSGETPARTPQVAVYLLNPYSPRQEEALAYLAYIAQAQEGSALVSLYEVNEPQESSEYRRRYAMLVENVQSLEEELAQAPEEERRGIQDRLDSTKHTMERVAENRYLVDEPAMDRYLALLPTFQMPAYSLPESAYETLLFRLLRGEMEEAEFCQELDRIQRAWLMENQIAFGE